MRHKSYIWKGRLTGDIPSLETAMDEKNVYYEKNPEETNFHADYKAKRYDKEAIIRVNPMEDDKEAPHFCIEGEKELVDRISSGIKKVNKKYGKFAEPTGRRHDCPLCGEDFDTPHAMKTHRGQQHYQCDECGKWFKNDRALSSHKGQSH